MNNSFMRILMLICFGLFYYSAPAQQRKCDLEAVCISPADTVWNGNRLPLRFGWQNLGPDTMFRRDTVFYQLIRIVDGARTVDYTGSFAGVGKDPRDRSIYNDNYSILFHYPNLEAPLELDYCVRLFSQAINARGDTIGFTYTDTNEANNTCCKKVVVMPIPQSTTIVDSGSSWDGFSLYPNPSSHTLYVRVSDGFLSEDWELSILDLFGRKIMHKKGSALHNHQGVLSLDVQSWSPGLYQLIMASPRGMKTKRFVVCK